MKSYKIRRKSDGLFRAGGIVPKYNKEGKVWKTMVHLRRHLALFGPTSILKEDLEILEYELLLHRIIPIKSILKKEI